MSTTEPTPNGESAALRCVAHGLVNCPTCGNWLGLNRRRPPVEAA